MPWNFSSFVPSTQLIFILNYLIKFGSEDFMKSLSFFFYIVFYVPSPCKLSEKPRTQDLAAFLILSPFVMPC